MIQLAIDLLWKYRHGLGATAALILWTWTASFLAYVIPKQSWMTLPAVFTLLIIWALFFANMMFCWMKGSEGKSD